MRRLASHLALLPEGLVSGVVVTLDDGGTVTDISRPGHIDGEAGVEFFLGILVPGFVNAHCHLELSYLRGAIPSGGGFTAFARGMRRAAEAGRRLAPEVLQTRTREAAHFWDARMWHEGVQAVGDVCNGAATFDLKAASRVGYHSFCELFGLGADPARVFELCRRAVEGGLRATTTPHSLYSLDREAFTAAVCDGVNQPLSIHFLESAGEVELYRRRGEMWDWYAEQGLTRGSRGTHGSRDLLDFIDYGFSAERLTSQVPADRAVMLIHNCLATQRDIDTVMGHFTVPVTWVVCPRSNRHISHLAPPIELLRRNGLRIAVGTDSLASNDTLSMVAELAEIENVPLAELLTWATEGGARALGLEDSLGTIAVGRAPGIALVEGVDMQHLRLTKNSRARRII